jgi:membrane peptidoglycan carboxypeptidase
MITDEQYQQARAEKVEFYKSENNSIKAPHFVEFVREYLEEKYGDDMVLNGGLKVTTTLDYKLQSKAEEIANRWALKNEKTFNAENAALVAIDPTTGGIMVMVGSRDYFDAEIDGNFNVTLAHRQPGSAFKPFVYATAFNKGYTTETLLFDATTEFSTACSPTEVAELGRCYRPGNYDGLFKGPITIRSALAESRNIPAVQALYLAGINASLETAKDMGIQELASKAELGLSLVLGGGEVSPLDITSGYSVFANDGMRNPYVSVLKVEDRDGRILEEYKPNPVRALPAQSARQVTDILSDNQARIPEFGSIGPLFFYDREVAVKTGTTNDYRDAWILGYTPQIAVGAWAGNNDNSPMQKKIAGFIVSPMWREFMDEALKELPPVTFPRPDPIDPSIKPILRGKLGGSSYVIDTATGAPATDQTPPERRQEVVVPSYHSILFWVDKNNPNGPIPSNPNSDPQFRNWEYAVQVWVAGNFQNQIPLGPLNPGGYSTTTGLPL